jgi:hypothetical protein|tara:strand:+ start:2652 stop:4034 length:1383 start_codon:yes stop_codon:yes gene_type:complete
MKKFYLLLAIAFSTSTLTIAQESDDGQTIVPSNVTKVNTAWTAKAGEPLGQYCGYSLNANPTGTNGNTGIMFDVEVASNLYISGFSLDLYGSTYTGKIVIYRKFGTHVGFENSPANWFAIDSVNVTDNGGLTYIPIQTGPSLFSGETVAFYIRGEGTSTVLSYANGVAIGNTIVSNSDLTIKTGTGKNGTFGSSASTRDFKGTIHYCKSQTVVCDTMQTFYTNTNGNRGVFFEVETAGQSVTINQIFADFINSEGTQQNVKVWTRSGSYIGFESSSIGWTQLSNDTIVSPIPNTPEAVSSGISVDVPANSVQSFYISSDGASLGYTNGVNLGDIVVNDPALKLKAGKGCDGTFSGTLYSPRIFHGTIDYCVTSSVGIDEFGIKSFSIYPNPAANEVSIDFGDLKVTEIEIFDINGQVVKSRISNEGNGVVSVDISNLSSGTYFVKSIEDSGFKVEKFVKL